MERHKLLENPYRPGAGHTPPFLAGRSEEQRFFKRLLINNPVTENILITGLRGVGKTVLLEQVHQLAEHYNWLWVGNDLSESSSLSEDRLALRILTDLSAAISAKLAEGATIDPRAKLTERLLSINPNQIDGQAFAFDALKSQFEQAPGLPTDRLKAVLQNVIKLVQKAKLTGIVLAYDEAQCLSDRAEQNQFPMSMLVEIVGSLQKNQHEASILLVLCGLPHVFDALTATRTYTERMLHVMTLDRLGWDDTHAALRTPLEHLMPPLHAPEDLLLKVVRMTGGYPYLIQFFGRELVDQILENGGTLSAAQFPAASTLSRLDNGLFAARWNRTTDRQRDLLRLIAQMPAGPSSDFSAADIVDTHGTEDFTTATAGQTLAALVERGLIYRTRHGRYAFTVPMSEYMILRRHRQDEAIEDSWQTNRVDAQVTAPKPQNDSKTKPPKKKSWFR
jgi:hypothetical protein